MGIITQNGLNDPKGKLIFLTSNNLTACCCIQVSKQQALTVVTGCLIDKRSCVGALGEGATGVKQLSALAAPGEKMLLNQEGSSKRPSLQGSWKPRGQRSPQAAMEANLFGCHGSTGEPWVSDSNISKKITPEGSASGMSTTHVHSSQQPVFTQRPCRVRSTLFAL